MTNAKISALASATTPLAGTEVLPVVQSGSTVKTTVADITGAGAYAGSFTSLAYTTTLTGGTGIINIGPSQFYKDATGNIGINTTTPAQKFTVNGSIALINAFYIIYNGATISTYIGRGTAIGGGAAADTGIRNDTGDILFSTGGGAVEKMRLTAASDLKMALGNVSISTSGKGITTSSSIPLGFGTNGGTAAMTLNTTGTLSVFQATTAAAPTYVKGAMYFDTTLNKLRIGGATAWETVTSV